MNKFRIAFAGMVGLVAGGLTPIVPFAGSASLAAPNPPITACSITVNNSTIYQSSADGPTMANFVIDTSSTLLKPATYYIWIVGSGSAGQQYMFPIQQTSAASAPYQDTAFQQSHSQLLSNATNNTLSQTAEPYAADIVITSGTSMNPVCQVSVTAAPNLAPSAPSNVSATAGNGQATVSWTPWKSFTGQTYTVTASPGGQTCTATHPTTSCTVSGLTNGTAYTFSVTNKTSGGTSAASTASASVTPSAPATTTTAAPTTTVKSGSGGSGAGSSNSGSGNDESVAEVGALPSTGGRPIDLSLSAFALLSGVVLLVASRRRSLVR